MRVAGLPTLAPWHPKGRGVQCTVNVFTTNLEHCPFQMSF